MIPMHAWTIKIFEVEIEDMEDRKNGKKVFYNFSLCHKNRGNV